MQTQDTLLRLQSLIRSGKLEAQVSLIKGDGYPVGLTLTASGRCLVHYTGKPSVAVASVEDAIEMIETFIKQYN